MRESTATLLLIVLLAVPGRPVIAQGAGIDKPGSPEKATREMPFINSLGMRFVPVPGTKVLFSVWETRVKDYDAFVSKAAYDWQSGEKMHSLDSDGWKQRGATWRSPGFEQSSDHPVVGVSWEDARAFCNWLSREEGVEYRLPTDAEWSIAVGLGTETGSTPKQKSLKAPGFPWGGTFPPPSGTGNYAGTESKIGREPVSWKVMAGSDDGHARTSPVGFFPANHFGLFDMSGNLWEWCEDWYDAPGGEGRVIRGGAWDDYLEVCLRSSCRGFGKPGFRSLLGFRCVLVSSR